MSGELIAMPQAQARSFLPVTREDVDALKAQRELLKEFIKSQLVEGIDNDFSVIPGTAKKSLLKPGAEKLLRLFRLGVRFVMLERLLDQENNFAMYTYKAQVFLLAHPDMVIAECEASCNSQEKKYKERKGVVNGVWSTTPTPIFDILNTLQKMTQKRAMVGAVIVATAAADFFSQDMDDEDDRDQNGANQAQQPQRTQVKIPLATGARSVDQGQSKPTIVIPKAAAAAPPKDTFEAFTPDLFGRKAAAAPEETIEEVQDQVGELIGQLNYSEAQFAEHIKKLFGEKAPAALSIGELRRLRQKYREEIQQGQVK